MLGIIVLCLAVLLTLWYLFPREPDWAKRFHGNYGWPFIGCAFDVDSKLPHLTYHEWSRKYGDIMKIRQFGQYTLVVSSYDAIYEVMVTKSSEFAGRPPSFREGVVSRNFEDVTSQQFSPKFINMKKLLMKGMRSGQGGVMSLEDAVNENTEELIATLMAANGQPIDIRKDLRFTILNIILILAFGIKLKPGDERIDEIDRLERMTVYTSGLSWSGVFLDFFPWSRIFGNKIYDDLLKVLKIKTTVIDKFAEQVKNSQGKRENLCIIDPILKDLEREGTDQRLLNVLAASSDLIVAGLTTTSALIYLLVNLFLHYPAVQTKAQEEIDRVAPSQTVTLEDRLHMPYMQATIFEALRYLTNIPLSLPHMTMCDTTLNGIPIPAGVEVITNLWALHHDERFWKNPYEFDPERFLEGGDLIGPEHPNRKRLLVFGAGRRVCLGEQMALLRIFLIVSNLLKKFNFRAPDGAPLVPCDPRSDEFDFGLIPSPPTFYVRPIPR